MLIFIDGRGSLNLRPAFALELKIRADLLQPTMQTSVQRTDTKHALTQTDPKTPSNPHQKTERNTEPRKPNNPAKCLNTHESPQLRV